MEEEEISSIVRITETFVRGLSRMTLNVAVAKIGLEGGNRKSAVPQQQVVAPTPEAQQAPSVKRPIQAA